MTRIAVLAALGAQAAFAASVAAQSIVIPDFRRPETPVVAAPGGECQSCGVILSIRQVAVERQPNVPPQFQGDGAPGSAGPRERNLVGAVVVLPFGGGGSSQPYVGGVGTEEMKRRLQDTTYEITVRLQDGNLVRLEREDGPRYRVGDRVRLRGTADLELIAG